MQTRQSTLVLPPGVHGQLHRHLFPGDGLEAAALLLCTVVDGARLKFIVRDIVQVPHDACDRQADALTWPGEYVEQAIDLAEASGLAIFAAHSHPGGFFGFSALDDASDSQLMPALRLGAGVACGSAIMTPDGKIRARTYLQGPAPTPVDLVMVPGSDITLSFDALSDDTRPARPIAAFTSGMTEVVSKLSACVIGVSGTGSVVAEQLARLGFGQIILIDFDRIERRNLNRILNAGLADIGAPKVDVFANAIRSFRPDCDVRPVAASISTRAAVIEAAEADLIFSCVDSAEGRLIADRLAASLAIPLFDVGISIPTRVGADGHRYIAEACGRIDYVFPGGSTLGDRGVYTPASLEADYLRRNAPETYRQKTEEGYIRGVVEEAPAVISLNMRAASACVMEFIARAFPFRHAPNHAYARTTFLLADGDEERTAEHEFPSTGCSLLARGLQEPLLGLPALASRELAA